MKPGSHDRRLRRQIVLGVAAVLAAGCSGLSPWFGPPTESAARSGSPPAAPPTTPLPGHIAPTLAHNPEIVDDPDLLQFLVALEQHGVKPLSVNDSQNHLLRPAPGLGYRLDNGHLHVHVYASAADANQRAQQVPTEVAQSIADWIGTPHLFECGRLLAMYFGDDTAVLKALAEICGPDLI